MPSDNIEVTLVVYLDFCQFCSKDVPEAAKLLYNTHIMSDAAYSVLTSDTDFTGNFVVDTEILAEKHGITDFGPYQVDPEADPATFQNDFFLPEKYDQ